MVIIPREELNRAAAGLTESRKDVSPFDRWMVTASGKDVRANSDPVPTSLYKNRAWRCE